ncbi:sulfatase [Nocardioides solisilvae]|uniref:sulfatase family protein n=1 Tax=Nocardioides solisilvae TaxID=1542435 RepID=UPI000D749385|nr:sulfatase [Nocardioides solisilvae]
MPTSRRPVVLAAVLALVVALGALGASLLGDVGDRPVRGGDAPGAGGGAGAERPNIVLVMTDDQTVDELDRMPLTRRALADGGMELTQALSPHPLCCPARAELVTGQYAQNNGVLHNNGPHGGVDALDPDRTLGEWFSAAGYRTAFVGKYLNKYGVGHGPQPGWDRWSALGAGTYSYRDFTFVERDGLDRHRDSYVTEVVEEKTNEAVRELAATGDPFLVLSWHLAPHYRFDDRGRRTPPPAAAADRGRFASARPPAFDKPSFDREQTDARGRVEVRRPPRHRARLAAEYRARVRSLQAVDRAVASLVDTLQETGEWEDTYLFFTSDNGYVFGEHRRVGKNLLLEEALRVPLLVAGPGVPEGSVSDVPVTLVDLPATFAALADVRPQRLQDGVSLVPLLRGADPEGSAVAARDTVLVQTGRTEGDGWDLRGVRTSRYLFAAPPDGSGQVLHDLRRDPFQLVDRAGDPAYSAVRAELSRRREALLTCAGPSCNREFGPVPEPGTG